MNINSIQSSLCEYWVYRRSDFNLLHRSLCTKPTIEFDYLSKTEVTLDIQDNHNINQFVDDFIFVKQGRTHLFFGVIKSYNHTQSVQMVSFIDYLDFPIHTIDYQKTNQDWCSFTANLLTNQYITNDDIKQNIPNLTITASVDDVTSRFVDDSIEQINFQEFRQWLFRKHNVVIHVTVSHNNETITLYVAHNNNPIRSINTSLFDVTNVTNLDFSMVTNKLKVYDKLTVDDVTTYTYIDTYYLLDDGSTTTDPTAINRLFPIVEKIVYGSLDDLDDIVATNLTSWEYQDELTFNITNDSKILDVESYVIGDPLEIHYGNFVTVKTKISGILKGDLRTTFKCGVNRYTLENYLRTRGRW